MAEPTSCCVEPGGYCARVDTLFNLPGVHVLDVAWSEAAVGPAGLRLVVETSPDVIGCPGCGVVAEPRGRRPLRSQGHVDSQLRRRNKVTTRTTIARSATAVQPISHGLPPAGCDATSGAEGVGAGNACRPAYASELVAA